MLNSWIVGRFFEYVEGQLGCLTCLMWDLPCLMGSAGGFIRVPMGLLVSGVTVEGFGIGRIGGTVAAGTKSAGVGFAAESTCLAVR